MARKVKGLRKRIEDLNVDKKVFNFINHTPEEDWSNFKNKDLIKIDEEGGNKVFQLIKLSYDHLPFHLKTCFAFCSLFPKDYYIARTTLIRLWVAQGFVPSSDESICLEDVGDKYFMNLVHRSFFQNILRDGVTHDILYFKMHDVVHDLARFISGYDSVLVNEKVQHIDKRTRHVSFGFVLDSSWNLPSSLLNATKLRTFLLPQHDNMQIQYNEASLEESACNSVMSNFRQFRALNLCHINSRNIPSCVGKLKHLRYLDLSYSQQIEVLPGSITKLYNLETLILNCCSMLRMLPKDLWKLTKLRHLGLVNCVKLGFMPRGIGKLTNLQTLTQFVLDTTSKHSAGASELGELNNLRSELQIKGLECLRHSPTEAKDINLMGKSRLQRLTLVWGEQINDFEKDDIILQGLLHSNIKDLRVRGFGSVSFFCSISSFTNLNSLSLIDCPSLQFLPQLHVKFLYLTNLPCLEWIVNDNRDGSSSTLSPSPTVIILTRLLNLKGWCRCNEEETLRVCCHQFKNLDRLGIFDCPNLISVPRHTDSRTILLENVKSNILQQAVNHANVKSLRIERMDDLKSLSGVLQHLTTLDELFIRNCKELDPCINDEDGSYNMQWKELKNLKWLEFCSIPTRMQFLPEGLQHVTTLQALRILDCVNLTCIPEWVTSLKVTNIKDFPKLTSLPLKVWKLKRDSLRFMMHYAMNKVGPIHQQRGYIETI